MKHGEAQTHYHPNYKHADHQLTACVHELFEQQAAQSPDADAVRLQDKSLTFRQLNILSNQLARRLQKLGIGPELLVGIFIERSLEMIVAVLGVLKTGGAFVPLDPSYPAALLSSIVADCKPAVIVTQQALAKIIDTNAKVICLDEKSLQLHHEDGTNFSSGANATNLAYVIYTSGSTGRPKGVMVEHRALVNYLSWALREYEVSNGNGALLHSSIAFDLTMTSLFCPLLSGRTLELLPPSAGIDSLSEALLKSDNLSFLKLTPTHLAALNEILPASELSGRARVLVIGGEALHAETVNVWRQHASATRLVNEYGPTEATVGCCAYEVKANDVEVGDVAIGQPIANARVYVLDQSLRAVEPGAIGELYLGGVGLARGYLNRPDVTAANFIRNPFSNDPNSRLYRSGDLVRSRPDGNLDFVGRVDTQVKIRGYRVELGEIEAVLRDHQAVQSVAVIAREDAALPRRLVAYVVPKAEGSVREDFISELRAFLKQRLPPYMQPSAFLVCQSLPVSGNGKIDRAALVQPAIAANDENDAVTTLEETLTHIWAEVLKLERVGIHDNFFDLGGDSLLGVQVLARARRAGLTLTPKQLFERQTIAELSADLNCLN